jgi:hypothetical protein
MATDKNEHQHEGQQRQHEAQAKENAPSAAQRDQDRKSVQEAREQARRAARPPNPELEEQRAEARREGSYGAQVILDYDSDAALGARGGAADTIEENTQIRDRDLVRMGHDPRSPDNSLLRTKPNFVPGPAPEPKEVAPAVRQARERAEQSDKAA